MPKLSPSRRAALAGLPALATCLAAAPPASASPAISSDAAATIADICRLQAIEKAASLAIRGLWDRTPEHKVAVAAWTTAWERYEGACNAALAKPVRTLDDLAVRAVIARLGASEEDDGGLDYFGTTEMGEKAIVQMIEGVQALARIGGAA